MVSEELQDFVAHLVSSQLLVLFQNHAFVVVSNGFPTLGPWETDTWLDSPLFADKKTSYKLF